MSGKAIIYLVRLQVHWQNEKPVSQGIGRIALELGMRAPEVLS